MKTKLVCIVFLLSIIVCITLVYADLQDGIAAENGNNAVSNENAALPEGGNEPNKMSPATVFVIAIFITAINLRIVFKRRKNGNREAEKGLGGSFNRSGMNVGKFNNAEAKKTNIGGNNSFGANYYVIRKIPRSHSRYNDSYEDKE